MEIQRQPKKINQWIKKLYLLTIPLSEASKKIFSIKSNQIFLCDITIFDAIIIHMKQTENAVQSP